MATLLGKSINDIKGTIGKHGGVAMQNRFAVYMQPPAASLLNIDLQNIAVSLISGNFKASNLINDPRDIAFLCESCNMPGRQITTIDYQSNAHPEKIPYGFINEDVTFTFLLTQDYYIKKIFDKWSNMVINSEKYNVGYHNDYTTDVVIQQLNKKNLPVYGVVLQKAYPVTFSSITLDNTSENSIQKFSVTMAYENFKEEGALSSALSSVRTAIGGITRIF
jgi:hypothetical protein